LLLHSDEYRSGANWPSRAQRWIAKLAPINKNPDCRDPFIVLMPLESDPSSVFKTLCDELLPADKDRGRVVVDITGGKKSMVGNAFGFAAYAHRPISYVDILDHKELEDGRLRPLGYMCRIESIADPYEILMLREWEQVQEAYRKYQFREALRLVGGIRSKRRFTQVQQQAITKLADVLEFYRLWDEGSYGKAWEMVNENPANLADLSIPLMVKRFGPQMGSLPPSDVPIESQADALLNSYASLQAEGVLFELGDLLLAYVHDEQAKIERIMINTGDYRSVLLRSVALEEFLLKTRLLLVRQKGWLSLDQIYMPPCKDKPPKWLKPDSDHALPPDYPLRKCLVNYSSIEWPRMVLSDTRRFLEIRPERDPKLAAQPPTHWKYAPGTQGPLLQPYWEAPACEAPLKSESLKELRNQAIHMTLQVRYELARAALCCVQANLRDFDANWAPLYADHPAIPSNQAVSALPWSEICAWCELGFLPSFMQGKEQDAAISASGRSQ